ncbi:glutathione S-transferase family protein [Ruegeria arenilitoris]|uniref:glutathione S-transferase family protein n=1 Tax=Ruegeria arenilitoris TaxID=1173585 RepID=UPI001479B3C1|nr:glutathione S-transferase family protein [Ruegeria arenilitoris]
MTRVRPKLYWISGSPPSWRVMLALTIKGIPFDEQRLDQAAGENRAPEYLALNPKGQVPTLVVGDLVIRESVAILAWLDRAFPERPIWGETPDAAAQVWQDVMEMEGDLRTAVATTARALLRGKDHDPATLSALSAECDTFDARLAELPFLGGDTPMASDLWLYPAFHWIARGVQLSGPAVPATCATLTSCRPALAGWMQRFAALPGVADIYPPHWRS